MRIQRTDKSVLKRFLKKLAHKMNWLFSLFKKKKSIPINERRNTRWHREKVGVWRWEVQGEAKREWRDHRYHVMVSWHRLYIWSEINGSPRDRRQRTDLRNKVCAFFFSDNCPVFRSFLLLGKDLKRFMCNYFLRFPSYTPWAHCVYFLISLINHFCRKYLSPLPFVNFLQCAAISQKVLPRK